MCKTAKDLISDMAGLGASALGIKNGTLKCLEDKYLTDRIEALENKLSLVSTSSPPTSPKNYDGGLKALSLCLSNHAFFFGKSRLL